MRKPRLVVFVVGETARADHVSFNGYERDTFPQLAKIDGVTNFSNVIVRHIDGVFCAVYVQLSGRG